MVKTASILEGGPNCPTNRGGLQKNGLTRTPATSRMPDYDRNRWMGYQTAETKKSPNAA